MAGNPDEVSIIMQVNRGGTKRMGSTDHIPDAERVLSETAGDDLQLCAEKESFNRRDLRRRPNANNFVIITKARIYIVLRVILDPVTNAFFNNIIFKVHIISDEFFSLSMIDELVFTRTTHHSYLDL